MASQHACDDIKEVNMTDPFDETINHAQELRTSLEFRKKCSRTEIVDKEKYKTKAASEKIELTEREKILEEPEETRM